MTEKDHFIGDKAMTINCYNNIFYFFFVAFEAVLAPSNCLVMAVFFTRLSEMVCFFFLLRAS